MSVWSDIAEWVGPTPNRYPGGMGSVAGVVLHIQEGTEAGTEAWQKNPSAQVSSHFLAPKAGGLRQMVDTADGAWAEVDGNLHWLSVECEGYSGQPLTDGQIQACAQLLARAHTVYGVPLQACDDPLLPGVGGLTGHGLGGAAWGGHTDCPGAAILAQRGAVIERAAQIVGGAPVATPTPPTPPTNPPPPVQGEEDMPAFAMGAVPTGFDEAVVLTTPPPNTGANWADVWVSFGADFADASLRIAYLVHGHDWVIEPKPLLVPRVGDRVNPFGGPAPAGLQKLSVKRVQAGTADTGTCPVGWLVEAAAKA